MNKSENRTIAVVGLGYVGLPLAILADRKGYKVIGVDNNAEKIDLIGRRICPFADASVSAELKNASIEATTDASRLSEASIVVICVPTPVYHNHLPNLEPVEGASRSVAKNLQKGQLVILESTVNPGVSEDVVLPILEKESGLRCGEDFYLAHCPERINPGDPEWNVENINRVVGAFCPIGLGLAVEFYESILTGKVKPMNSLKEAEACKVVENSYRDINIAFVNELAMSFSMLGIDVVNVIEGAATKPFSFLPHFPGCGVGGHCIPVDPYYLIEYAKQNGFEHDFLALARRINNGMPEFTARQAMMGMNERKLSLNGAKVAVLGLSYKAGIDDCRESPSFEVIEALRHYGAKVVAYDPFVLDRSDAKTLEEAVEGAQAVVIATGHDAFKNIAPAYLAERGVKVVVDGRNCLDKEAFVKAGLVYKGIGR